MLNPGCETKSIGMIVKIIHSHSNAVSPEAEVKPKNFRKLCENNNRWRSRETPFFIVSTFNVYARKMKTFYFEKRLKKFEFPISNIRKKVELRKLRSYKKDLKTYSNELLNLFKKSYDRKL